MTKKILLSLSGIAVISATGAVAISCSSSDQSSNPQENEKPSGETKPTTISYTYDQTKWENAKNLDESKTAESFANWANSNKDNKDLIALFSASETDSFTIKSVTNDKGILTFEFSSKDGFTISNEITIKIDYNTGKEPIENQENTSISISYNSTNWADVESLDKMTVPENQNAKTLAGSLNEILKNGSKTDQDKIKSLFSATGTNGTNGTNIVDSFNIKNINADNPKGGIVTFELEAKQGFVIDGKKSFDIYYPTGKEIKQVTIKYNSSAWADVKNLDKAESNQNVATLAGSLTNILKNGPKAEQDKIKSLFSAGTDGIGSFKITSVSGDKLPGTISFTLEAEPGFVINNVTNNGTLVFNIDYEKGTEITSVSITYDYSKWVDGKIEELDITVAANKTASTLANALNQKLTSGTSDEKNRILSLFGATKTNENIVIENSFNIKNINANNPKGGIVTFELEAKQGFVIDGKTNFDIYFHALKDGETEQYPNGKEIQRVEISYKNNEESKAVWETMKKDYDSNTNTNNKSAATLANALNEILNNANPDLTKLNKIKSLFSASGTNGTNIADSFKITNINATNPKGGIVTFILSENPGYEIANNNLTSEKTVSFDINYSDGTLYVPSINPPALK